MLCHYTVRILNETSISRSDVQKIIIKKSLNKEIDVLNHKIQSDITRHVAPVEVTEDGEVHGLNSTLA